MDVIKAFLLFLLSSGLGQAQPSYPGHRDQNNANDAPVTRKLKYIDSPLTDIQWLGGKHNVFVLTEKGQLYRSTDGGATWTNQQRYLAKEGGSRGAKIKSMHISKKHNTVFFIGHGDNNWATIDGGDTFIKTQALDLIDVRLHPTNPEWFLASGNSAGCTSGTAAGTDKSEKYCYRKLYVTKNSGRTFTPIRNYVVQYEWAPEADGNEDLVYATVHSVQQGNQKFGFWDQFVDFVATTDYFSTVKVVVEYGNRFIFGEHNYVFVAAVNPHHETSVNLMITRDAGIGKKFTKAKLPVEVLEHSYTILDTSEGSVFLHVNHNIQSGGASTGNVYISDASGTSYSLSLPFNHRDKGGKCDFEKVEGLEGIYLANFVDVDDKDKEAITSEQPETTVGEQKKSRKNHGPAKDKAKIKTVITFDKGGIWSYLNAPKVDARGDPTNCKGGGDSGCHLHLHGITDAFGPFYSLESATGIIMATGSLGNHLHDRLGEINTYLSRDAGLTWKEVAKGSHIYEYGDHGGLIVMAFDEGPTDHILYTWDEGRTWNPLKISDFKFEIENVIIEPSATSLHFVVYGYRSDNDGVLISLDFASLHQSECKGIDAAGTPESDYEFWSPSDGRMNGQCLMGHKVKYTRRKQDAQCYNPEEVERMEDIEHCVCTEEDFECDYGFARSVQGGPCERIKTPDGDDPSKPPESCNRFYTVTQGYRRVAGDTCRGGSAKWDPIQVPCPTFPGAKRAGKFVLAVLFLVVVSLGLITAANKFDFVEEIKSRWINDYKKINQDEEYVFDDDEDDMNQTAELVSEFNDPVGGDDSKRKGGEDDEDEENEEDLDFDEELDGSKNDIGMEVTVSVPTLSSPEDK
mmetsp:Transcript_41952/g.70015  ORF Transcript_41952/g.70015 Transcript_41952/m.70015 type:complete len:856 (+) Transcript_41952:36-2603(+)